MNFLIISYTHDKRISQVWKKCEKGLKDNTYQIWITQVFQHGTTLSYTPQNKNDLHENQFALVVKVLVKKPGDGEF